MNEESFPARRGIVTLALAGIGGLVSGMARGENSTPASDSNRTRTSIHQETDFAAPPDRIYGILLDSKSFAAMTGLSADIGKDAGGAFAMFGGIIIGRNIELAPGQRIVQAWKPNYWPPGVYSLVKFELVAKGMGTTIMLDHTGFPEGKYDSLYSGWPERYWHPLEKYLTSGAAN